MRYGNSATFRTTRGASALLVLVAMFFLGAPVVRTSSAVPRDTAQPERKLNNQAEEAFRRARELCDEENWSAAVAKFEEFLALYPQDRNVPATYYWLAMALKKQTKYAEADERLARLINEFPNSSWANDARTLRVEIAGLMRNVESVVQSASEENENVKLTALQSLLRLDPPRALELIADLFRPDSSESLNLKLSVVTLLGRGGGKAAVPLLSQVINQQTVTELRVGAVYALAQIDDPAVFDVLKGTAGSDNKRVTEAALFAVAHLPGENPRAFIRELARTSNTAPATRRQSILLLAQQETESAVDELLRIYEAATDVETRHQTVLALGLSRNPRAQAKLWEIARQQDGNTELRSQAILALGQGSESQALDNLIQLYDLEKNEEIREWIVLALAQSSERSATGKLMAIARSDPSAGLRRMAVLSLQRSSDPAVRKFLQEMDRTVPNGKD